MFNMKSQTYSGVKRIVLDNCGVVLETYSPWRIKSFLSRVGVDSITEKQEHSGRVEFEPKEGVLNLEQVRAKISLPYGGSIDVHAKNNSKVGGTFFAGRVDDDKTSQVCLDVPLNISRRMGPVGSTIAGVAGDLGYIAATCIPIGVVGVPLVRLFGGDPINAFDDILYLSAGVNVGLRGNNKRAFFTTLAVATGVILGPEAVECVRNGLEAGLNQIGSEDLIKAVTYTAIWGAGKALREYHARQTERVS